MDPALGSQKTVKMKKVKKFHVLVVFFGDLSCSLKFLHRGLRINIAFF
jgi:hypothetical protein